MSGDKQKQIIYGAGIFLAVILFSPYIGLNLLSSGRVDTQAPSTASPAKQDLPPAGRPAAQQPPSRDDTRPLAPRETRRRETQKPSGGRLSEIEELLKN